MNGIPKNAAELIEFLKEEILHGIELDPDDSRTLLRYLRDRHARFFGPFTTYFVLGSYEKPFKYRLDDVADELNSRVDAYAYLQATQKDMDLEADLPELKLKFYIHALYADYITTVLEHNTGGTLVEFGRMDQKFLFDRTFVFPRCLEPQYESWYSETDVRARAIEIAFEASDKSELDKQLNKLATAAQEESIEVTTAELQEIVADTFRGHLPPSYTSLIPDGAQHYRQVDRCITWTTEDELIAALEEVPKE